MRVNTKTVIDIESGDIISREYFVYTGPTVQAFSIGGSGGKTKSKQKSQQQSFNESGTDMNNVYRMLTNLTPGHKTIQLSPGSFNAQQYLAANPDVANDKYFSQHPFEHYTNYGINENRPGTPDQGGDTASFDVPDYNPTYVKGTYTPVDSGDFNKIEQNLYGSQQSRLSQAYNQAVAQQREQLAQTGALNSPSQFLEGGTRSSLDRDFLSNLQQAARDASNSALTLKQNEAARRTAFDTGEAGRETEFNQTTAQTLLDTFLKKLALALQGSQFSRGFGEGSSSGSSSGVQGGGNLSIFKTGGQ